METRNYQSAASATPPSAPGSPSNGYATNGNPGTGTPATLPGEFWFHKVGEELRGVLVDRGLTPSDANLTQLVTAIKLFSKILLTANLTIYVATTGNDSTNTGLTVGSPFLTIQKAWDTLLNKYDINEHTATIQIADGTYTGGLNIQEIITGQNTVSSVIINGNSGTPSNVIISTTSANAFTSSLTANITVQNLKVQTTTAGSGLAALRGGVLFFSNIVFGACATSHISSSINGIVNTADNYSIVSGSPIHISTSNGGRFYGPGITVTLTGTPAFSNVFAVAVSCSSIAVDLVTYTGAATGTRYSVILNSVINTNGGGANFLPGNAAGSVATGGQYA